MRANERESKPGPYQVYVREFGSIFFLAVSEDALSRVSHKGTEARLPFETHLTFGLETHLVFAVRVDTVITLRTNASLLIHLAYF